MDRLRKQRPFQELRNFVEVHSRATWRQILLSSLGAYEPQSGESVPGSARTNGIPPSYMGENCVTEQQAHESAACDIFIALLLAIPHSLRMVPTHFDAGWDRIDEIRRFAETLQPTWVRTCRGELHNDVASLEWFRNYFREHEIYTDNPSPLHMNNSLVDLHPRLGLRDFVNRHLDTFAWLDEKNCQFTLKSRIQFFVGAPPGLECIGKGCQTH